MISGLLLIFLLSIVEAAGFPMAMTMPFLVASLMVLSGESERELEYAILGGLIVDLVFLGHWGSTSLVLLLISSVGAILKMKFRQKHPWSLLGLGASSLVVVSIIAGEFEVSSWLFQVVVMIIWFKYLVKPMKGSGIVLQDRMS